MKKIKLINIIISIVFGLITTLLLLPKTYEGFATFYSLITRTGVSISENFWKIILFSIIEMAILSYINYIIISKINKKEDMNELE